MDSINSKTIIYRFILIILSIFSTVIFFNCASTTMTSFIDPAYRDATFKRFVIVVRSNNFTSRKWLESLFVEELTSQGIYAKESILLFPPTREYSKEQKQETLIKNKYDAYIVVDVGETGVESIYIPPTKVTQGHTSGNKWTEVTNLVGGGTIEKPWAQVRTTLCDASTNDIAWIADSYTGGNGFANFNTVADSYCEKVIDQLKNIGMIHIGENKYGLTKSKKYQPKEILQVKYALQNDPTYIGTSAAKYAESETLESGISFMRTCSNSPIKYCIYDRSEDPKHLHCIFCGLSEKR